MRKEFWLTLIIIIALAIAGILYLQQQTQKISLKVSNDQGPQTNPSPEPITPASMQITSPAFLDNQSIPEQYTCDGQSLSIPLNFSNVPAEAKSLSLVMDDPDVPTALLPSGLFVHWVVFNMPATTTELAENQTPPGIQGNNGAGKAAYTAPCPPDKQHRYFFKLYALDAMLNLPGGATKDQLEQTMEGHIIAQAQLIGLYNKKINQK